MFSASDFLAVSLYHSRKKKRGNKHCTRMIDHVLNFIRLLSKFFTFTREKSTTKSSLF